MKKWVLLFLSILFSLGGEAQLWVEKGTALSLQGETLLSSSSDIHIMGSFSCSNQSGILTKSQDSLVFYSDTIIHLGYLGAENAVALHLQQELRIDSLLELKRGHVKLENVNLTLSSFAHILGYDSSRFIVAKNERLVYDNIADTSVVFPIGNSPIAADYSLVKISGPISSATLSMRIEDGVWSSYSAAGNGSGTRRQHTYINQTWDFRADRALSDINLEITFSEQKLDSSFNRNYPILNAYHLPSGLWATDSAQITYAQGPEMLSFNLKKLDSIELLAVGSLQEYIHTNRSALCSGDSLAIWTIEDSSDQHIWRKNEQVINGENDSIYWVHSSGTYDVIIIKGGDSIQSVPINIVEHAQPIAKILGPTALPCQGDTALLSASAMATWSYEWFRQSQSIPSSNAPILTTTLGGLYVLKVTDSNFCSSEPDSLFLSFRTPPNSVISGEGLKCFGDSARIKTTHKPGNSYRWLRNGLLAPGSVDSSQYLAPLSGSYQVLATDSFGCQAISSSFTVFIDSIAVAQPLISSQRPWFCEGDSIKLNESHPWQFDKNWLFNGVVINSSDSFYWASSIGTYELEYSLGGRCLERSKMISISQIDTPQAQIWASSINTFCKGDSIQLNATVNSNYNYTWIKDTTLLGLADSSLYAKDEGVFSVRVSNGGNCPIVTNSIRVFKSKLDSSRITLLGNTLICENDSALLKAKPQGPFNYQWYRDSVPILSAVIDELWLRSAGHFWVKVSDAANCEVISDSIQISVQPLPGIPRITRMIDTLFTDTHPKIQWYKNGQPIQGANGAFLPIDSNANYHLIIEDSLGCSRSSDTLTINNLSTAVQSKRSIQVFPNPNTGVFSLSATGFSQNCELQITDYHGRMLYKARLEKEFATVSISSAPGIYFLTIREASGMTYWKRFAITH